MKRKCIKKLQKYIPLYEESIKIKEEYIESYDMNFYNQIKIFNIIVIIVYTSGLIMEFHSGIEGAFLICNILWISIMIISILGVIYSHFSNNIKLNYWIMCMLIVRICGGLV